MNTELMDAPRNVITCHTDIILKHVQILQKVALLINDILAEMKPKVGIIRNLFFVFFQIWLEIDNPITISLNDSI